MTLDVEFIENVQDFDVEFGENIENTTELEAQIKTLNAQIAELEQYATEAYEAGKQAGYDRFWDSIQVYGTRTRYERTFEYTQWDKPFNPKYSLGNVLIANYIFSSAKVGDNLYTDKLDFSKCLNLVAAFMASDVTRLKRIDMRACSSGYNGMGSTFFSCGSLKEITEFYPSTSAQFNNTFGGCSALETINFCSELAVNGLNLSASKNLGRASIESIINAMSDSTSGLSVTLSKTAVDKAFETSEGANDGSTSAEWLNLIASKSNWTINLV